MADPDRVMLDTSALYALISSSDDYHKQADKTYRALVAGDAELWITSYVLVEFGALVHHRLGFEPLSTFLESTQGVYETVWIDSGLHAEAWSELLSRRGSGLNFVDWTTAVAARLLGAHIFTFDTGFAREGATVIP